MQKSKTISKKIKKSKSNKNKRWINTKIFKMKKKSKKNSLIKKKHLLKKKNSQKKKAKYIV